MAEKDSFSTEEVTQAVSTLSDGEYLCCTVPVSPVISLEVLLDSKAGDYGWLKPELIIKNRERMIITFNSKARRIYIPHTIVEGSIIVEGSAIVEEINTGEPRNTGNPHLNAQDVIDIFALESSVKWQISGVVDEYGRFIREW